MPEFFDILWDEEPGGNIDHLAEHGVNPDEATWLLRHYFGTRQRSRSTPDYWLVQGTTAAGRYLIVVFEYVKEIDLVNPVTAYEPFQWNDDHG